jgi:hypothetical protein
VTASISTNATVCEPRARVPTIRPTIEASASCSTGTPYVSKSHRPAPKRSSGGTFVAPAKRIARSSCSVPSTLTQSRPLATTASCDRLDRLMQTSMVGGRSVTEHAALTVMPARPCGPSVATTLTAADRLAMAARKARCVSVSSCVSTTSCLLAAIPLPRR